MRDDRRVSGAARHRDGVERFRDGADLIQLDEQRVADAFRDPLLQDLRIGHEHIVADELHAIAERPRQRLPAVPVAFGDAVFNRHDRILPRPSRRTSRPSAPACASARPTS